MTVADFRPIFERVMADYGLSAESRAVAWESCIQSRRHGKLRPHAVRCYVMLDRTRGPWISASAPIP